MFSKEKYENILFWIILFPDLPFAAPNAFKRSLLIIFQMGASFNLHW